MQSFKNSDGYHLTQAFNCLANGCTIFIWKLYSHWLEDLWQSRHAAVMQGPVLQSLAMNCLLEQCQIYRRTQEIKGSGGGQMLSNCPIMLLGFAPRFNETGQKIAPYHWSWFQSLRTWYAMQDSIEFVEQPHQPPTARPPPPRTPSSSSTSSSTRGTLGAGTRG